MVDGVRQVGVPDDPLVVTVDVGAAAERGTRFADPTRLQFVDVRAFQGARSPRLRGRRPDDRRRPLAFPWKTRR